MLVRVPPLTVKVQPTLVRVPPPTVGVPLILQHQSQKKALVTRGVVEAMNLNIMDLHACPTVGANCRGL
jgi:hypothetical protein